MFEWPALGALVAVALPVAIIFLVLGIFRIVQLQAERAVRSPEYWDEVPDGKRYPTGWGEDEPGRGPTESAPEQVRESEPGADASRGDTPKGDDR